LQYNFRKSRRFERSALNKERLRRIAVVSVLVLGTLGLLYLRALHMVRSGDRRIGIVPEQGEAGAVAAEVSPGGPAERGGILPGDEILEVSGRRVRTVAEYREEARGFRRGQTVELQVRRAGGTRVLSVNPGLLPSAGAWTTFGIDALTALCYVGIALLAWLQGAGDLRARLLVTFSLALALELGLPVAPTPGSLWVPAYLAAYYLLTGLQMGVELHLASLIPERPEWLRIRPWVVPLYYGVGLGLGMVTCASYLAEELLDRQLFPWSADAQGDFVQEFGMVGWAVAVSLLLVSQALRATEPVGRQQAGLVLAGTLPWLLFVLAFSVLTRLGWELPGMDPVESVILLCYPLALFAAIYRYQLFDIELVVRRSLIYAGLTGSLILVFYAALGAGGFLFSQLVEGGERSVWVVSASTLLLGLLVSPLRRALQRLIERRLFPERQALRRRLVALAGELPALGRLPRMGQHLVERLTGIFDARSSTLLIAAPETRRLSVLATTAEPLDDSLFLALHDPAVELLRLAPRPLSPAQLAACSSSFAQRVPGLDPGGLAVPLVSQERLIGILLVGHKEGRRGYPAEEVDLLNLLAHHVATVFENARLFASATYEGLTGLLRREAILEQLDQELERAHRYGRPLTIAMADLDHFKSVNDRHGHLAGDSLLRRAAQVISGALRSTDSIGRYGGEEFLLVLPETDLPGAGDVAEKIRSLVQRTQVPLDDGSSLRATLSIGLASLDDLREERGGPARLTSRDLIAAADQALYEAKNGGRNRVHPLVAA
jgi:diguanylate cyclase (GGDEF)-like protein